MFEKRIISYKLIFDINYTPPELRLAVFLKPSTCRFENESVHVSVNKTMSFSAKALLKKSDLNLSVRLEYRPLIFR
jgi:hypothetical protein